MTSKRTGSTVPTPTSKTPKRNVGTTAGSATSSSSSTTSTTARKQTPKKDPTTGYQKDMETFISETRKKRPLTMFKYNIDKPYKPSADDDMSIRIVINKARFLYASNHLDEEEYVRQITKHLKKNRFDLDNLKEVLNNFTMAKDYNEVAKYEYVHLEIGTDYFKQMLLDLLLTLVSGTTLLPNSGIKMISKSDTYMMTDDDSTVFRLYSKDDSISDLISNTPPVRVTSDDTSITPYVGNTAQLEDFYGKLATPTQNIFVCTGVKGLGTSRFFQIGTHGRTTDAYYLHIDFNHLSFLPIPTELKQLYMIRVITLSYLISLGYDIDKACEMLQEACSSENFHQDVDILGSIKAKKSKILVHFDNIPAGLTEGSFYFNSLQHVIKKIASHDGYYIALSSCDPLIVSQLLAGMVYTQYKLRYWSINNVQEFLEEQAKKLHVTEPFDLDNQPFFKVALNLLAGHPCHTIEYLKLLMNGDFTKEGLEKFGGMLQEMEIVKITKTTSTATSSSTTATGSSSTTAATTSSKDIKFVLRNNHKYKLGSKFKEETVSLFKNDSWNYFNYIAAKYETSLKRLAKSTKKQEEKTKTILDILYYSFFKRNIADTLEKELQDNAWVQVQPSIASNWEIPLMTIIELLGCQPFFPLSFNILDNILTPDGNEVSDLSFVYLKNYWPNSSIHILKNFRTLKYPVKISAREILDTDQNKNEGVSGLKVNAPQAPCADGWIYFPKSTPPILHLVQSKLKSIAHNTTQDSDEANIGASVPQEVIKSLLVVFFVRVPDTDAASYSLNEFEEVDSVEPTEKTKYRVSYFHDLGKAKRVYHLLGQTQGSTQLEGYWIERDAIKEQVFLDIYTDGLFNTFDKHPNSLSRYLITKLAQKKVSYTRIDHPFIYGRLCSQIREIRSNWSSVNLEVMRSFSTTYDPHNNTGDATEEFNKSFF